MFVCAWFVWMHAIRPAIQILPPQLQPTMQSAGSVLQRAVASHHIPADFPHKALLLAQRVPTPPRKGAHNEFGNGPAVFFLLILIPIFTNHHKCLFTSGSILHHGQDAQMIGVLCLFVIVRCNLNRHSAPCPVFFIFFDEVYSFQLLVSN